MAGVFLLLVGALSLLLNSTTVLEYAVDVAEHATDQRLTVAEREGTMAGPVELGGLRWRANDVDIAVERLYLEWYPGRLLFGRFDIARLHLDGVQVGPGHSPEEAGRSESSTEAVAFPSLPLPVRFDELRIDRLQLLNTGLPERWAGPYDLRARLKLAGTVATVDRLVLESPAERLELEGQGDWHRPDFTARVGGTAATPWGEAVLEVDLRGSPERIDLDASLAGPADLDATGHVSTPFNTPEMDVQLGLKRLGPALTESLPIPLLVSGEAHLRGGLEILEWDARLEVEGDGPDPQHDIPNLRLAGHGRLQDTTRVEIVELALDGDWRGHPLKGRVEGHWTADDWHLPTLSLSSGPNRLVGEAREQADTRSIGLSWSLPAPERLFPGVEGIIEGGLDYRDDDLTANVEVSDLGYGDHHINRATLALQGTGAAAEWRLSAPDPELALYGEVAWANEPHLRMDGGRGRLPGSDWFISHPWRVTLDAPAWNLSRGCLALDSGGEFCLEGGGTGRTADLRLDLADLELPPLVAHHVPGTGLQQGSLHGEARLDWDDGLEEVALHLTGRDLHWRQELADNLPLATRLDGLDVVAAYAPDRGLSSEAIVRAGSPQGELRLNLALPLWKPGVELATTPLAGRVDGSLAELDWLGGLVPGFIRTTGRLETDLSVAGRFASPLLAGTIGWREGRLQAPAIGLDLTELDVSLTAASFNEPLTLDGRARAHHGDLRISGELTAIHPLTLDIRLQGHGARLANTPEVRLLAEPDLHLTLRPGHLRAEGEVVIPQARIDLPNRDGIVQPSTDVIRMDEKETETAMALSTDVRVILGPRVHIRGYGFEGRLEGDLRVLEEPGQPPVGRGELVLREGRYRAWGQDLSIDAGRLFFADSPLDNPGLDIRAVRNGIPVVAGVRIIGRARSPELILFSDPPMDDTEILSYVVLGRPISESGTGDGEQLARAATALQLAGGARIARTIGERFGIDEVGLATGTTTDETALVLGSWLSPRLHLRYAIGVTEDTNTLRANYLLSDHWSLETETGPAQGMDLMFTIDR